MAEPLTVDSERLARRLDRANAKIDVLERMIEDKTRTLYLAQEEIRAKSELMASVLSSMEAAVILTDAAGTITDVHGATEKLTGTSRDEIAGRHLSTVVTLDDGGSADDVPAPIGETRQGEMVGHDGPLPVLLTTSALAGDDTASFVIVASDVSELRRLEIELRHAQKLESVGQLAAGVAHEINTPIQFVGDSVSFIGEAITDALELIGAYRAFAEQAASTPGLAESVVALRELEEELDLEFIEAEAPASIQRTKDGVERVAEIVAAMKQFSHPGGGALAPVDLNEIVESTLVVARNEYKYVAEVALELREVPPVMADRGDIGQVVLNLLVNAAHAIRDLAAGSGQLGTIRLATTAVDGGVELTIADDGGGVPADIRERIFDPFFTTKEPGQGTGQGLAIARTIVVDRHGGRLTLDVDEGVGSTFSVWLSCD